ncbi:carbohydrate kinase family protein [Candidatus Babeliales bacterium]|nr:carbohydrate kinase family protein [Candidatus Babeliales bacterium]
MPKKQKVLTIGGATQDIYLHYEGSDCMKIMESTGERSYMLFESGSKVEVDEILTFTGGGSTNSAVSFSRLGFDTSCFCMVGDDIAGTIIIDELAKENINTSNLIHSKEHESGRSFVINSIRRDRTIFAHRGANGFLSEKDIPFDAIKQADQLYITSLSHRSSRLLGKIVAFAKKENKPVAINPGISQLSKGAKELKESLQYIDILILNSSEAKTFMPALVESTESVFFSIKRFLQQVLKMGPKVVVVTDGVNGVHVASEKQMLFRPSLQVDVVDTLGAGDSFGSCFVALLLRGESLEEALAKGIVNAASVIGKMGAKPGLLTASELEERAKSHSKIPE